MTHLFRVENIERWGSNFFWNCDFCQQGISSAYPGLQLSHWDHPPKKFRFRSLVLFRGSPCFLAISGQSPIASISTLNFKPWSTKLGRTVRSTKKLPTMTIDLVPAGITEEAVSTFCRKAFFWPKVRFFQKKKRKNTQKIDIYLGKGYFFLCTILPVRG